MARLILAAIGAIAFAVPAHAQSVESWSNHIREASIRFGVPEAWIRSVMRAESAGRTHINGRPIVSSAGAMGLMQLMPETWTSMRLRLGLGRNPHDPRDNILAGTHYLRTMYDRFGYPGLFAAYNAGPGRYASSLAGRRRLPLETRNYVASVAPFSARPSPAPITEVSPDSRTLREPPRRPDLGLFAINRAPAANRVGRYSVLIPPQRAD